MRVLVTGGAGFIGSHLVDALVAAGHDVTVVDDLTTGREENLPRNVGFNHLDIRDPGLKEIFHQREFEAVFHYAALVDARESVRKPGLYHDVNVRGSLNVLRCCEKHEVRKVIYASTVAVYGEPREIPVEESHPTEPLNTYGASKLEVERHLAASRERNGLDFAVLRYANVYGPRQNDIGEAGVVAVFARKMILGEPVTIYGDGDQVRDFVFVSDAVAAALAALEDGAGRVYNIGTGRGTTVNELFDLMRDLSDYAARPRHGPARDGEIVRMVVDPAKVGLDLAWRGDVFLSEGLTRTLDHVAESLARASA